MHFLNSFIRMWKKEHFCIILNWMLWFRALTLLKSLENCLQNIRYFSMTHFNFFSNTQTWKFLARLPKNYLIQCKRRREKQFLQKLIMCKAQLLIHVIKNYTLPYLLTLLSLPPGGALYLNFIIYKVKFKTWSLI